MNVDEWESILSCSSLGTEGVSMGRGEWGRPNGEVVPNWSLGGGQLSMGREAQKWHSRP